MIGILPSYHSIRFAGSTPATIVIAANNRINKCRRRRAKNGGFVDTGTVYRSQDSCWSMLLHLTSLKHAENTCRRARIRITTERNAPPAA
jgi:hypothetical protein